MSFPDYLNWKHSVLTVENSSAFGHSTFAVLTEIGTYLNGKLFELVDSYKDVTLDEIMALMK